jgi:hypothetical protein
METLGVEVSVTSICSIPDCVTLTIKTMPIKKFGQLWAEAVYQA